MDLSGIGRVKSLKYFENLKIFLYKAESSLWPRNCKSRYGANAIKYFWKCLGSDMGLFIASGGAIPTSSKMELQIDVSYLLAQILIGK